MKKQEVPEEVLGYAESMARNGGFFTIDNLEERVKEKRDRAIEAIRIYKDAKKEVLSQKTRQDRIDKWLKSLEE